jgi:hypothetical protein
MPSGKYVISGVTMRILGFFVLTFAIKATLLELLMNVKL